MVGRAPNAWLVAAFAVLAGGGVGAATATLQAALRPWQVGGFRPDPAPGSAVPRAEAAETTYAFGTMPAGGSGRHEFVIRNAGTAPLTLQHGASSCSCTIGGFAGSDDAASKTAVVAPGGSTPVTVTWTGKGGGPFRQQVTILTDDPRRPEIALVVEGTVVPSWKAVPATLVLPAVSVSSGASGSVSLFTYGPEPPVVNSLSIDHPDATRHFAISSTPLATDVVAAEAGATGGFRIDVEVRAGLPAGRLRQTVTVEFEMGEPVTAQIPMEGVVGSDLLVAGPGWDAVRQVLVLGTVSGAAGFKTRLYLTAKGRHRDAVRPEVLETVPAALGVTVGAPVPVGSGGSLRIQVDIEVPPGSRPANHLCSRSGPPGKIVLATGHPEAPTLTIPVCIAIGP